MKPKRNECDLSVKSLNFMLGQEEDLPWIGYWKVVLLEKNSEDELYEFLLRRGKFSDEDVGNVKGNYIGAEILRKLYLEKDPLSLILKVHLLVENFINELFIEHQLNGKNLTFKEKADLLREKSLISVHLYSDVSLLNQLRNNYAHNYYYDLGSFSVANFSCAQNFYEGIVCKRKSTKALLNLKTMQFFIFPAFLDAFLNEFPFLTKKELKKSSKAKYYKESIGEKIGRLIDKVDQLTKGDDVEWGIKLEIRDKSKKKIKDKNS